MDSTPPEINIFDKAKMAFSSIDQISYKLLFARLPLNIKRKLPVLFKYAPSLKHDILINAKLHPKVITHLYQILLLLNRGNRKTWFSKEKDSYFIHIGEGGEFYKFLFNLFPSPQIPIFHDLTPLVDIFVRKLYDYYPIKGSVVDIGGYIGDTSVYFVKKGAQSVEVYEPSPFNFNYLTTNLRLNDVSERVKPFRLAIANDCRNSILFVPRYAAGEASLFRHNNNMVETGVETISCHQVLNKHIDLLKMDCKGCEVQVIEECGESLQKNVDHLIFQYYKIDDASIRVLLKKIVSIGFVIDKIDVFYKMVYAHR